MPTVVVARMCWIKTHGPRLSRIQHVLLTEPLAKLVGEESLKKQIIENTRIFDISLFAIPEIPSFPSGSTMSLFASGDDHARISAASSYI